MNEIERKIYEVICQHDGIKAREIAEILHADKTEINRLLYCVPFIHELCYHDEEYLWYGMIRQARPHSGLGEFCGYYGTVGEFLELSDTEWLSELRTGCRQIGRNLNDTRGLIHSFLDSREVMKGLFLDLEIFVPSTAGTKVEHFREWEICFELRIRRAHWIRIYADVLIITGDKVFSLEFKMKDVIDPDEELQAVKYAPYLEVIFGRNYDVIPCLVLTKATDLYTWQSLPGSTAEIPVCSGDMLFNLLDEHIGFL